MQLSFARNKTVETERVNTIADGIAVCVPVLFSLDAIVDEVLAVTDGQMLKAMSLAHRIFGLVVEPSGIAGLVAILTDRARFRQKVGTVFCWRTSLQGR